VLKLIISHETILLPSIYLARFCGKIYSGWIIPIFPPRYTSQ